MKRVPVTENDVKALVKKWFDDRGAWSYAPVQNGFGVHGVPDRVGCVPITITQEMVGKKYGVFVAVECKKPGRRNEQNWGMSKHQMLALGAIHAAGGFAVRCDGEEDLEWLNRDLYPLTGWHVSLDAKYRAER